MKLLNYNKNFAKILFAEMTKLLNSKTENYTEIIINLSRFWKDLNR